jgi:asparagine synthase (glutamine-hydrolysing)
MCGIAGIFDYQGKSGLLSDALLKRMCDTMAYRGPDDAGVFSDGPVGLGHRRLSILDLSALGHQPMASPDGAVWITFNGEIYNYRSLRDDLVEKGYAFRSDCDTEVLIALYQEYGEACVDRLRGMFAFAIWDAQKERLFMVRDRLGKKPLFYLNDGQRLVFASEIKAILADPSVPRELNYPALADFFRYHYVPDPKTIYQNILKLPPGHCLRCDRSGIRTWSYWNPSFQEGTIAGLEEAAERLLEILSESVRLRMISDVPLGAFLSGGIDSSGVVALMAQAQERPVTTCSIGFDSEKYDEIHFARAVAERFQTDHHEFVVKDRAEPILSDLAYWFDEPFADASAVPTYFVSKMARRRVTVALAGDGGDENFAGYSKYGIDQVENRIRSRIPRSIRRVMMNPLSGFLSRFDAAVLRKGATLTAALGCDPDYGFFLSSSQMDDRLWNRLARPATRRAVGDYHPFSVIREAYGRADGPDHLSRILYTDLKTYLAGDILVKVDRMSMANSLEVRAPLLDHNVVEFAAGLPIALKFLDGEKKRVLKRTFRNILPDGIMDRKKMGFEVPLDAWLRGELREFAEGRLFSKGSGVEEFFEMDELRSLWRRHQSGRRNFGTVLWAFFMFELWHERFIR